MRGIWEIVGIARRGVCSFGREVLSYVEVRV